MKILSVFILACLSSSLLTKPLLAANNIKKLPEDLQRCYISELQPIQQRPGKIQLFAECGIRYVEFAFDSLTESLEVEKNIELIIESEAIRTANSKKKLALGFEGPLLEQTLIEEGAFVNEPVKDRVTRARPPIKNKAGLEIIAKIPNQGNSFIGFQKSNLRSSPSFNQIALFNYSEVNNPALTTLEEFAGLEQGSVDRIYDIKYDDGNPENSITILYKKTDLPYSTLLYCQVETAAVKVAKKCREVAQTPKLLEGRFRLFGEKLIYIGKKSEEGYEQGECDFDRERAEVKGCLVSYSFPSKFTEVLENRLDGSYVSDITFEFGIYGVTLRNIATDEIALFAYENSWRSSGLQILTSEKQDSVLQISAGKVIVFNEDGYELRRVSGSSLMTSLKNLFKSFEVAIN